MTDNNNLLDLDNLDAALAEIDLETSTERTPVAVEIPKLDGVSNESCALALWMRYIGSDQTIAMAPSVNYRTGREFKIAFQRMLQYIPDDIVWERADYGIAKGIMDCTDEQLFNRMIRDRKAVDFLTPFSVHYVLRQLPDTVFLEIDQKKEVGKVLVVKTSVVHEIRLNNMANFFEDVSRLVAIGFTFKEGKTYLHTTWNPFHAQLAMALVHRFVFSIDDNYAVVCPGRKSVNEPPIKDVPALWRAYAPWLNTLSEEIGSIAKTLSGVIVLDTLPKNFNELDFVYYLLDRHPPNTTDEQAKYKKLQNFFAKAKDLIDKLVPYDEIGCFVAAEKMMIKHLNDFDKGYDAPYTEANTTLIGSRVFRQCPPLDEFTHDLSIGNFKNGNFFLPHVDSDHWGVMGRTDIVLELEQFMATEKKDLKHLTILGPKADQVAKCVEFSRISLKRQPIEFAIVSSGSKGQLMKNMRVIEPQQEMKAPYAEVFHWYSANSAIFFLDNSINIEGVEYGKQDRETNYIVSIVQSLPPSFKGFLVFAQNIGARAAFDNVANIAGMKGMKMNLFKHPRQHNEFIYWVMSPSMDQSLDKYQLAAQRWGMCYAVRDLNHRRNHFFTFGWDFSYNGLYQGMLRHAWETIMKKKDQFTSLRISAKDKERAIAMSLYLGDEREKNAYLKSLREKYQNQLEEEEETQETSNIRIANNNNNNGMDTQTPLPVLPNNLGVTVREETPLPSPTQSPPPTTPIVSPPTKPPVLPSPVFTLKDNRKNKTGAAKKSSKPPPKKQRGNY
jgi:hypothetical protein